MLSIQVLDSVGEEEGRMIWENNIEMYTLSYARQMISASSMQEAGHVRPVLWDNLEG